MIEIRTGNSPELEAYLAQRIYEYNAAATGYHDGESFAAIHQTELGKLEGGAYGYTWGGCCYIAYLWVSNAFRRKGIGSELLDAIERHARQKRCRLILLSTHSFQAPGFYVRRGYEEVTQIKDYPVGHASIFFAKQLDSS